MIFIQVYFFMSNAIDIKYFKKILQNVDVINLLLVVI